MEECRKYAVKNACTNINRVECRYFSFRKISRGRRGTNINRVECRYVHYGEDGTNYQY